MTKQAYSQWFAGGSGHVWRVKGDNETYHVDWNGKPDGHFRFVPHVKRYVWNGQEYKSRAAVLRAIADKHGFERKQLYGW